jgi:threonine dehydrogenase-like Zn-dependent dehydrogenase
MKTIIEPSKELLVAGEVDVLVAGCGPAGIAAATAAVHTGASVVFG